MNSTERRTAVMEVKAPEREPDERLLIEAAQSEPARFADLYDRNFARVYAFFARRVETREEAQDLTADVFHQALASIRNFRWQGAPFVAWLYGIAANVLAAHWQKLGKTVGIEDLDLSSASEEIERSVMLSELVDALSPQQRLVIMLRFTDQKSIREIAQELGRSEGAVKQLQLRALENLREKIGGRR
ncbi:MAG TPA: sigma-70 family RNA polymerase sigma factor [Terriglobales bacterium]|nr:sigma-70 family RNA polymerase sigma factor [Terriglobales bacterium]